MRKRNGIHSTYPQWARSYARWTVLSAAAPFATLASLVVAAVTVGAMRLDDAAWSSVIVVSLLFYYGAAIITTVLALLAVLKPRTRYVLYALELGRAHAILQQGLDREDVKRTQPLVAPFTFIGWVIGWVIPNTIVRILCFADGLGCPRESETDEGG